MAFRFLLLFQKDSNRRPRLASIWSPLFMRICRALAVLIAGGFLGYFVYVTTGTGNRFDFKLGLDLSGGSRLVYEADVSDIESGDVAEAMNALRDVIENRINAFGVAEPLVQVEEGSIVAGGSAERLVVELPGVTDIKEAAEAIGRTPLLEFKLVNPEVPLEDTEVDAETADGKPLKMKKISTASRYIDTGLTGRYLEHATLQFGQGQGAAANEPIVQVTFNDEGAELFAKITTEHVGEQVAIFLDGEMITDPVIREPIKDGVATITGKFTAVEGRELVRSLNLGALPVPITLASTETIGAALGSEALKAGVTAGVVGFILLAIFMILWYRLPGLVAVVALVLYVIIMLALFKLIPVVLTAAGIAGFILSIGLAVDANILIAERIKEELARGKTTGEAIREGFSRAWLAIRDSNIAHIIASVILFWFGTALIKGFALVFAIGVFVSMFSAITISRTLLLALGIDAEKPLGRFLLRSGVKW
ncbi:protein translocase subunit SecD [Candidatus Kaiserbacteria bacterium]|nr:protein translocase subunit SecD [Candidatus Kaiserbacteria bacterium]